MLKSLQVEEGRQATVTAENIKVLPDFGQMGVPGSGVLFHLIELPQHGELTLSKAGKRRRLFTLDHLTANKLKYIHNGNEDIVDRFVFEMEIQVGRIISLLFYQTCAGCRGSGPAAGPQGPSEVPLRNPDPAGQRPAGPRRWARWH